MKDYFLYVDRDEMGLLTTVSLFEAQDQLSQNRIVVREIDYKAEQVQMNNGSGIVPFVKISPQKDSYTCGRFLVCSYVNKKHTVIRFNSYDMVKLDILEHPFPILLEVQTIPEANS